MRKMFRGYYYPTEAEFSELWEKGIFIFDANILLNIYRYSENTRKRFIEILTEIADRTIIPHQAAKEYQNNRLKVIQDQNDAYEKLKKYFQDEINSIKGNVGKYKRHPSINKDQIIKELDTAFNKVIGDLDNKSKKHPDLFKNDDLRDELTDLLEDKIWKPFPEEVMNEIWEEGKKRYENKIPPGYKDKKDKKGIKKCGDLILWYQILDIAKEKKLPIILVTDDKKEDWWWEFNGRTIGPRRELVEEIYDEAGVLFYMYKTDNFIKRAEKKFFDIDTEPSVIQEVKDAMSENETTYFYFPKKLSKPKENNLWFTEIKDFYEDKLNDTEYNLISSEDIIKEPSKEEIFYLKTRLSDAKEKMLILRTNLYEKEDQLFDLESLIRNASSNHEFFELDTKRDIINDELDYLRKEVKKSEVEYDKLTDMLNKIERGDSMGYKFIECPKCGYVGLIKCIEALGHSGALCQCPECGYRISSLRK